MTDQFETISFKGGVWQGLLQAPQPPRCVILTHLGETVAPARLTDEGDRGWRVAVAIPPERLAEGVHSFVLLADEGEGAGPPLPGAIRLATLPLMAGGVLDQDLLAEINLLKTEIELLKREFRRIALNPGRGQGQDQ